MQTIVVRKPPETAAAPAPPPNSGRLKFVDALRGLAALGVVLHHTFFCTPLEPALRAALPQFVQWICADGVYGVEIFFVLSGFVISKSLVGMALSFKNVINFILRRQIRLDPPYWVIVTATVLAAWGESLIPHLVSTVPNSSQIVLNLFYLHKIAKIPQIVGTSWTLCIEIQFYLAYIALLCAGWKQSRMSVALVFALGVVSMVTPDFADPCCWFIPFWHYFAGGALCLWALQGLTSRRVLYCYGTLWLIAAVYQHSDAIMLGLFTTTALYVVGRLGKLTTLLSNNVLQYFGKISYSLYLTHLLSVLLVMRIGYKLTADNQLFACLWAGVAIAVAVGSAHLLNKFVEGPSMRLASRLKT